MIKKQKLSITTTSIRNLTGTELDTVAGGIVSVQKCPSDNYCPDPTVTVTPVYTNVCASQGCSNTCATKTAGKKCNTEFCPSQPHNGC